MYDPYGQNLTNVTNVPPVGYPIIYQSPTRQIASNVQTPAPATPNQMVYQQPVPIQQQSNEYYGKNVYKPPPQNYNPGYYPTYVPYVSYKLYSTNHSFRHLIMLSILNSTYNLQLRTALQILCLVKRFDFRDIIF